MDLTTFDGDPGAILALPGATVPADAEEATLMVVVVDLLVAASDRSHFQDTARYDLTLGQHGGGHWKTLGWCWTHDYFCDGPTTVVAAFPAASFDAIRNPETFVGAPS